MKQYVIDELRFEDYDKLKLYLDKHLNDRSFDGVYWIPLESELFSEVQAEHKDCQPYFFALELEQHRISCELLVRTKGKIRCDCICHANEIQRNWLIDYMDAILEKLEIIA
ncbi:MAG: hypothetical protein K9L30_08755 [Desulfobacterales bacterium]|nr:hypothetical protein [Desulfobacterales bacterium]